MIHRMHVLCGLLFTALISLPLAAAESPVDQRLNAENEGRKAPAAAPVLDDLPFLRRVMVDLIGRIPTQAEVLEFQQLPVETRRALVIDKLLADARFSDRWTVFFADMLRIRTGAEGGGAYLAFVHQSLEQQLPYDKMCRQLIAANGRANVVPEVGFVLGDDADPMALAGATAQTFLGIRIACAQCHDHPFDQWKRDQFYGLAAYFGQTRRVERRFKMTLYGVFTQDVEQTSVLWPPEGVAPADKRQAMKPAFPFTLDETDGPHVERLAALRAEEAKSRTVAKSDEANLDDLLDAADATAKKATEGADEDGVLGEAKNDVRGIDLLNQSGQSQRRALLADQIVSPRNHQFARALVNRVWAELVGQGFVNPIDDFSEHNAVSHPQTLDYLAEEFIANGYNVRQLVRMIATTDAYQRGRLADIDEKTRREAEDSFVSAPVRRMTSEVLYDSIVLAGHLFEVKHEAGKNMKTQWILQQLEKAKAGKLAPTALAGKNGKKSGDETAMAVDGVTNGGAKPKRYDLESALEVDFNAVLKAAKDDKEQEPDVEEMEMVSKEQLEAEEAMRSMRRKNATYIDQYTRQVVDDNPKFTSSLRMASPADPSHFLRVFGQPPRDALGQFRDSNATMRQALMMLNGRLTHEAARVGELEPVFALVSGKQPNLKKAVELVYMELFTRAPSATEVEEGVAIINDNESKLEGLADLRWILFNSHEFRFVP